MGYFVEIPPSSKSDAVMLMLMLMLCSIHLPVFTAEFLISTHHHQTMSVSQLPVGLLKYSYVQTSLAKKTIAAERQWQGLYAMR